MTQAPSGTPFLLVVAMLALCVAGISVPSRAAGHGGRIEEGSGTLAGREPGDDRPPPTIVEKVFQQILVERDLDAARALLTGALVEALGQVHNPRWIARIYSLLSAIEVYEGDEAGAERYALRAVALDPAVQLEAQLGDAASEVLSRAGADWKERAPDAGMSFPSLPGGLEVYVDGEPCALPGSVRLKPGDHLVQVAGPVGVVARKWVTLESGAQVANPPPIPQVLEAASGGRNVSPLSGAALLEALARAGEDARAVTGSVATLLDRLDEAVDARRIHRAACFQARIAEAGRLAKEVEGFAKRLEAAARENDGAEVLHLVEMVRIARTQSEKNLDEAESCFDIVDPSAPPEVLVLEEPPAPPAAIALSVPGGSPPGAMAIFPAPFPERFPRFTLLRPETSSLAESASRAAEQREAAGAGNSKSGRALRAPWWRAEIWADTVIDSNPDRLPATVASSSSSSLLEGVLALTPSLTAGGKGWHAGLRYPLRLGTRRVVARDFEAVARGERTGRRGKPATGLLEVRHDTFTPVQLGGGAGLFQRTAARTRVGVDMLPPGALAIRAVGEASVEKHAVPDAGTHLVLARGGTGVQGVWHAFPRSAFVADVAIGVGEEAEEPDAVGGLFASGRRHRFAARLRVGFTGQLAPHLSLDGRVGPQFTRVSAGDTLTLGLADVPVGKATLRYARGPFVCWLGGERVVSDEVFADAVVASRGELGAAAGGTGWLRVSARLHAGREALLVAGDAGTGTALLPGGWWPVQRYVGGDMAVQVRFRGRGHDVDLRLSYAPVERWGVPEQLGGADMAGSGRVVVHQAFAGVHALF